MSGTKTGAKSFTKNTDYTYAITRVEKKDFAKFIRKKLKEYNKRTGKDLKTKDIAASLDISYEMYRKILNQEKPTQKRDCIIAICIANKLRYRYEINEALNKYQYMPGLDEDSQRDRVIINEIDESNRRGVLLSIKRLNLRLWENGLPELDIHGKRNMQTGEVDNYRISEQKTLHHYDVIKSRVISPVDYGVFYNERSKSLGSKYNPIGIHCKGDMIIKDTDNDKKYYLSADSYGELTLRYRPIDIDAISYKTLAETGEFETYFSNLLETVEVEMRRFLETLKDTRNYQCRSSARVIDDTLCVFTEEFNYDVPALNEYYLLSYSKGQYEFRVYEESAFMSYYLSEKDYEKYYEAMVQPKEKYMSVEHIDSLIEKEEKYSYEYMILRLRRSAFEKLKKTVDSLIENIKERKVFIHDLKDLDNETLDVIERYSYDKKFKRKFDNSDNSSNVKFQDDDNQEIIFSIEELQQAFELGLDKIDDIIRIKSLYGSLSKVLE